MGFGYNAGVLRRLEERAIRRKRVYDGRAVHFNVDRVRLPNGKNASREYVDHPGAAAVLPLTAGGAVVLVRQCRYPVGRVTFEIPAGKLDGREAPRRCAIRELREETGYSARRLRKLLTFWPAPAFSNENLHIFIAEGLVKGSVALDEDEFVEVVQVPFQKALDWIRSGKIKDAKTIIGIQAYALEQRGIKRRSRRRS